MDESCGEEIRITVIATGIETESEKKPQEKGGVVTVNPPRQEPQQPEAGTYRGRTGHRRTAEDILSHQTQPYSEYGQDDTDIPTYLRYQERAKQYQEPAESFTIEEDDSPSFIRKSH
jgi:hypothetical protein